METDDHYMEEVEEDEEEDEDEEEEEDVIEEEDEEEVDEEEEEEDWDDEEDEEDWVSDKKRTHHRQHGPPQPQSTVRPVPAGFKATPEQIAARNEQASECAQTYTAEIFRHLRASEVRMRVFSVFASRVSFLPFAGCLCLACFIKSRVCLGGFVYFACV